MYKFQRNILSPLFTEKKLRKMEIITEKNKIKSETSNLDGIPKSIYIKGEKFQITFIKNQKRIKEHKSFMDCGTQTDLQVRFNLLDYVLDGEYEEHKNRKIIDLKKPSKDDIIRINFHKDLNNALKADALGNLPIHQSVLANNLKEVKKNCAIIKAIQQNIDIENTQHNSPLHLAVVSGAKVEIISYLIKQNAEIDAVDSDGNNAIDLAIEHQKHAQLEILLKTALKMGFNINLFNHEGYTPIIKACLIENIEAVQLLLNHGADPNVGDLKSGRTALFHAAELRNEQIVKLLLERGADLKKRNFFGMNVRDALFEMDNVPFTIKGTILGKEIREDRLSRNNKYQPQCKKYKFK